MTATPNKLPFPIPTVAGASEIADAQAFKGNACKHTLTWPSF